MKCEKCLAEMKYFIEGSSQGWNCPNCGWGIVTTYIKPIYEDDTNYSLKLCKHEEVSKDQMKIVSYLKECNYIKAKNYLTIGDYEFEKAKAPRIREIARKLKKAKISFDIYPEFKYPYE